MKPFDGVTFGDLDGDQLFVTVRFANTGTLNPAGHGSGVLDGVNDEWVFDFVGSASDLTNWFQNDITFDFYDSNVPGPDVTTNFRIEVKDSPQATSAVNQAVSVLTHVMGPVTNHAPTGAVFDRPAPRSPTWPRMTVEPCWVCCVGLIRTVGTSPA